MKEKLYRVDVAGTLYVLAEDDEKAEEEAVLSELSDCGIAIAPPVRVRPGDPIVEGWEDAYPFCKKANDKTVGELVEPMEATEEDILEAIEFLRSTNCKSLNLVATKLEEDLKEA